MSGKEPSVRDVLPAPDERTRRDVVDAGLRYVSDEEPGIRRRRCGRGFSYVAPDGLAVDRRGRERIASLAIPPAWTDVWICADVRGHPQATGRDVRGRKQYRYHAKWREVRDGAKFDKLSEFGERQNGSFGLTTLRHDHVEVVGSTIGFTFVGKGGREHATSVRDRRLARAVRACHELGGRELFTYLGDDGEPVRVDSADCNDYLARVMGAGTTVKYFRTWGGSVTALESLVDADEPLDASALLRAVDAAAERLGNTRAVCRRAYVHPLLTDDLDPSLLRDAWRAARSSTSMSRAERALLRLLQD